MYNKPTKFDENRWSHFWENENVNFFLIRTILNFEGRSKTKKEAGDIECERDWSVSLGSTLDDGQKIKNYFSSVILFIFKCTINTENLIKIVGVIFQKIRIFNFFSCELPLILGVGGKLKKGSRYLQQDPSYRIWTRSVDWFRFYDREGQTDRQTYTQIFLLKHIFRLWEWCRIKNHKI